MDAGQITLIAIIIMLLIVYIVYTIYKNYNSKEVETNKKHENENNLINLNDKVYPNKTEKDLSLEALEKVKIISSNKKGIFVEKIKKYYKLTYATYLILFFFCSTTLIISLFLIKNIFIIVFIAVLLLTFLLSIIFCIVNLLKKLNKPAEELLHESIINDLKKIYSKLTYKTIYENMNYVKSISPMCKNILDLNTKYEFDYEICKKHIFSEAFNSKRQFDNFNYKKWLNEQILANPDFFYNLEPTYEENIYNYYEYLEKYKSFEKYLSQLECENFLITYEVINAVEHFFYKNSKKTGIIAPNIDLNISYTSSSGRNHYENTINISYHDIQNILHEEEEKRKIIEKRKEKERRLKELDKIEIKLNNKQKELEQREAEFELATKGHIYSSNTKTVDNFYEENNDLTVSQKLKLLKTKFDNGELTYDEYKEKRKEIF